MNMKNIIIGLLAIIAITLSSCSSEPEWADPEALEQAGRDMAGLALADPSVRVDLDKVDPSAADTSALVVPA